MNFQFRTKLYQALSVLVLRRFHRRCGRTRSRWRRVQGRGGVVRGKERKKEGEGGEGAQSPQSWRCCSLPSGGISFELNFILHPQSQVPRGFVEARVARQSVLKTFTLGVVGRGYPKQDD